jgi:hypothetical protein
MFVSRKKLKALVDENVALKKQNRELMADNERLSDSNLDLWWDNKMLRLSLCRKKMQKCGEYFYTKGKKK